MLAIRFAAWLTSAELICYPDSTTDAVSCVSRHNLIYPGL